MSVPSFLAARFAAPALLVATLAVTAVGAWVLSDDVLASLMRENGPIESTTAVLFLIVAATVALARRTPLAATDRAAIAYVLACGFAREVSLRRWLLEVDVGSICCTPQQVRFIVSILLVALVVSGLWLVARFARRMRTFLALQTPSAVTLATFGAALVLSQIFDRAPKIWLGAFGRVLPEDVRGVAAALEETVEMLLPVLALLAVAQAAHTATPRQ